MFSFHHWFLLLFFGCFCCWLHLFISSNFFTLTVFFVRYFVFVWLNLFISPTLFTLTVRYFIFVLLYRECYAFERAFFTLRRFLPYTPSPHLPQYREFYRFERAFFSSKTFSSLHCFPTFSTTCFNQGFPGSQQFLKAAGSPTEVRNTNPIHLFGWIRECAAKAVSR